MAAHSPQTLFAPLAVIIALTAIILGPSGCQEANRPDAVPKLPANTPEAKLEEVMSRLRTGVIDAAAAEGSGVISQRKVSHRLIPPDGDQDDYRAEITIQTTVALANAPAAVTLPRQQAEEEPDPLAEEEEPDDPLLEGELEEESEQPEEPADNGVTRRAVEQSRKITTKVYELIYDNERWKLVDEISAEDDEVAKYLFEFALAE